MSEPMTRWQDQPSLIKAVTSLIQELPVPDWFKVSQPLELELGCGDGSFLKKYAAAHPETNFIGVERLKGRLNKLDRAGRRGEMKNLALLRFEAAYLMRYLLPAGGFRAIHVYFPDPWPKKRHRRHRLINPEFTELATRLLGPDGRVYLRTDDVDYFEQMLEVFDGAEAFAAVEAPTDLTDIRTDFETCFNDQGIPTNYATYRLTA
ncbi:MAG: tRNA (guanine-N7-)-methyltransferase [Limisphaerales bacterium]|jgi:tRNA (guanine-N7-)-methyltransferase